MSSRGRGPGITEFNAGGATLGKPEPSLRLDDPGDGANLEEDTGESRKVAPLRERVWALPEWNLQKAVEITCFVMFLLFVVHGLGELFGYFQDQCDRPHMIIKDEDRTR